MPAMLCRWPGRFWVIPIITIVCLLPVTVRAEQTVRLTPAPVTNTPNGNLTVAKPHLLPPPQLEVDLSDCLSPGEIVSSIEVKPLGDILLIQQRGSLIVVERAAGRKLWCRAFRETFDPAGKVVTGVQLGERMGWSVAVSGMVENLGVVIIMQADKTAIQEDKSSANGLRWVYSDRVEAVQAATGRVLWQSDWQEKTREGRPFWLIGMVDGLLVESPYLYNELQHKPMRLRSAATGTLLDPTNSADRAAIQKAAAHHANKPVLMTSGPSVYAIDLHTGTSAYVGLGGAFQIIEPAVFPIQHRVVRFFRGDDDMVGHSNWPDYVTCNDINGENEWSLPRVVERPLPPEKFSNARPQRISRMVPCRDAGSVLCVGDDKWYGLDVRDGRVLWTNATPMRWTCNVVEAANGFLVAIQTYNPTGKSSAQQPGTKVFNYSLAWVDGRTGKFRWLAKAPLAVQMQVVDSDLFLFDASAHMHIYSLSELLTPPRQKSPASDTVLVPRQTYRVDTEDKQDKSGAQKQRVSDQMIGNRDVAVTSRVVVVGLHDGGNQPVSVVAFDRSTGRELWRKERTAGSNTNGSELNSSSLDGGKQAGTGLAGSDVPNTDLTPRVAQTNDGSAEWWLLGTAARADGSGVVILTSRFTAQNQTGKQPAPEEELHGVEADTGRELWRITLSHGRWEDRTTPLGIYGSLVALLYPDQVYNAGTGQMERRKNGNHAGFLDAFTGHLIIPTTPEEQAALKRVCEQYASPIALSFANSDRPRLLHLDTGMAQNLDKQSGYANPVGVTASRGVIFVNMDDDGAGHSVWPHYVYGVYGTGKTAWEFPKRRLLPGADFDSATGRGFEGDKRPLGYDFEDILQAQVIAAFNTVFVVSSTPYHTQKRNLYSLSAGDGHILWRKSAGGIDFLRAYKQGCFALMQSGQLTYVNAQTGQQRSCGRLPLCLNLLVGDGSLFAINSDGTVTEYNINRLLKPTSGSHSQTGSAQQRRDTERAYSRH